MAAGVVDRFDNVARTHPLHQALVALYASTAQAAHRRGRGDVRVRGATKCEQQSACAACEKASGCSKTRAGTCLMLCTVHTAPCARNVRPIPVNDIAVPPEALLFCCVEEDDAIAMFGCMDRLVDDWDGENLVDCGGWF